MLEDPTGTDFSNTMEKVVMHHHEKDGDGAPAVQRRHIAAAFACVFLQAYDSGFGHAGILNRGCLDYGMTVRVRTR